MNNSECKIKGWMHDFRIIKTYPDGVLERCTRCKEKHYFKNNVSNTHYLSYHLRATLQPWDKRYKKEYAKR
jgi:hypothetical protein